MEVWLGWSKPSLPIASSKNQHNNPPWIEVLVGTLEFQVFLDSASFAQLKKMQKVIKVRVLSEIPGISFTSS